MARELLPDLSESDHAAIMGATARRFLRFPARGMGPPAVTAQVVGAPLLKSASKRIEHAHARAAGNHARCG